MDFTPPPPPAEDLLTPAALSLPPSAQDYRRQFFYGPFGLRAIWSLLIYLTIVGAIIGSLVYISHEIHLHHDHAAAASAKSGTPAPASNPNGLSADAHNPTPMSEMLAGEALMFAGFLFVSWIMARIEHRRVAVFGLGGAHPISRCLIGALWGLLSISLLILALHSLHLLVFDHLLDHGPRILFWGFIQLLAFLLVGLTEEYTFRGYLQFTLTRGLVSIGNLFSPTRARTIGFWLAAVLTSALFLYAHTRNAGENWLGLFQVFLAGMIFVVALWRTGSLWWGIGFHTAWDWGQSFLYGVPDSGGLMQGRLFATHALGKPLLSGGTVGPEGSVLCIPVFLFAIAILFFTHPSPQPPLELPESPLSPSIQDLSLSTHEFPHPDSSSPVA